MRLFARMLFMLRYSLFRYRVFCLLGDGEMAEGAVWEAMAFASHYKYDGM